MKKINKPQARFLTHVVCDGPDWANTHSEKIAATQLQKLGLVTIRRGEGSKVVPSDKSWEETDYIVTATEAGRKRILG